MFFEESDEERRRRGLRPELMCLGAQLKCEKCFIYRRRAKVSCVNGLINLYLN